MGINRLDEPVGLSLHFLTIFGSNRSKKMWDVRRETKLQIDDIDVEMLDPPH